MLLCSCLHHVCIIHKVYMGVCRSLKDFFKSYSVNFSKNVNFYTSILDHRIDINCMCVYLLIRFCHSLICK